jgi:hypothetical protein
MTVPDWALWLLILGLPVWMLLNGLRVVDLNWA